MQFYVKKFNQTKPDVPKLVKNTTLSRWNYSIKVHVAQVFGSRKDTLEYFLRINDAVVSPYPPLLLDHLYSAAAGSIQGEQALCLSLNHPLYRDDNKFFLAIFEVNLRGTTYEASINPFQSTDNGRGAYKALIDQNAGKDKWVKILRDAKTYVNEIKWDENTSYLLQAHIEKCRECHVDIENASEHVTEQVPNPCTRVKRLLGSIEGCTDPKICARVSVMSTEANGMQADFELAVSCLLTACPVAAKISKKRNNDQISGLGGKFKAGTVPKTGVELWYHKPPEFEQLSDSQIYKLL